jgi:hypothetical protein
LEIGCAFRTEVKGCDSDKVFVNLGMSQTRQIL